MTHYHTITMVMETMQIRLTQGLIDVLDSLVEKGIYANRSDVIRDAIRKFYWESQVGIMANKGDSVKLIRETRKKLSKEKIDINEINNL